MLLDACVWVGGCDCKENKSKQSSHYVGKNLKFYSDFSDKILPKLIGTYFVLLMNEISSVGCIWP